MGDLAPFKQVSAIPTTRNNDCITAAGEDQHAWVRGAVVNEIFSQVGPEFKSQRVFVFAFLPDLYLIHTVPLCAKSSIFNYIIR